jgi:putative transposase
VHAPPRHDADATHRRHQWRTMPRRGDRYCRRDSTHLPGYDYTRAGAYFVTICARDRARLFGEIRQGVVHLSEVGALVATSWVGIGEHFSNVSLDAWVLMPNHLHGIISLSDNMALPPDIELVAWRASHTSSVPRSWPTALPVGPIRGSLGAIVGSFKSATTKQINRLRSSPGVPLWQRGYYEHIIGNAAALEKVRRYIADNPFRWSSGTTV